MKIPNKEAIKNALAGLVPDDLVENAKSQLIDKAKASASNAISGVVPDSMKASAEKLMDSAQEVVDTATKQDDDNKDPKKPLVEDDNEGAKEGQSAQQIEQTTEGKTGLAGLIPEGLIADDLIENTKAQLQDKVKDSMTDAFIGAVPASLKSSAEALLANSEQVAALEVDVELDQKNNTPTPQPANPQPANPQPANPQPANPQPTNPQPATQLISQPIGQSTAQPTSKLEADEEQADEEQVISEQANSEQANSDNQIITESQLTPEQHPTASSRDKSAIEQLAQQGIAKNNRENEQAADEQAPPVSPPPTEPQKSQEPPQEPPEQPPEDEPEDDSPDEPQEPVSLMLTLFGGAGIGLLFGVIMGMSVTPTVATVLGALTAMLTGILGMNDKHFSNAKAVRIGGFGFACVFGAFLGLYVRAHNSMAPSMMSMKEEYIAVGFSEEQSLAFIAQKVFGASLGPAPEPVETAEENAEPDQSAHSAGDEGASTVDTAEPVQSAPVQTAPVQTAPVQTAPVQFNNPQVLAQQHASLLFSADVDISSCEEMENTDDTLPLDEVLNNFELTGDMWEVAYYWATENIDEAAQKPTLLAAKDAICSHDKIDQDVCKALAPLDATLDSQQVADEFANHESWQPLASFVAAKGFEPPQQTQTLLLIKNTICGTL